MGTQKRFFFFGTRPRWSVPGVLSFYLAHRGYFLLSMLSLLLSSGVLMVFPLLAGRLIDIALVVDRQLFSLNTYITLAYVVLFVLLQSLSSYARVYFFSKTSELGTADMRRALFAQFTRLPLAYFDDTRSGDMFSRVTTDVALIQHTFANTFVELSRQLAMVCIGLVMGFVLAPSLATILLAGLPFLAVFAAVIGRKIRSYTRITQGRHGMVGSLISETIQLIKTVKAFGSEGTQLRKFAALQHEAVSAALRVAAHRAFFIAVIIFAVLVGALGVIAYGAWLVQRGVMTMGDLFSFVLYAALVVGSIMGLGDAYSQWQKAMGASRRLVEVLREKVECTLVTPIVRSGAFSFGGRDILFARLSFAYPSRPNTMVLSDVNLRIAAGSTTVLVGRNGAGKSTLLQLLLRFYTPTSGVIRVGEQDSHLFPLDAWRRAIGIIPQEVMLFSGTIEENIRCGCPDANAAQVERAAHRACVLDFAEQLPHGLRTQVGEKGAQLSGGQRQRIGIARTILRSPSLVLLDEATTFLDLSAAPAIQKNLEEFLSSRTAIAVTHEPSTSLKADQVYIVADGKVIEEGAYFSAG